MVRAIWKGPYIEKKIIEKVGEIENKSVWSKHNIIVPQLVGHTIMIYTGKTHVPVKIKSEYVGHKLGEFVTTKKIAVYPKKSGA